jgi:hypothetical protein
MPFGLYTRTFLADPTLAQMTAYRAAQGRAICFLTPAAGFIVPEAWMDVYRRAYEEAQAALEPSRLQLLLQPSRN